MSSNGKPSVENPQKLSNAGSGRLPSLNQLAARMNANPANNTSPLSLNPAQRPRLAASVLRTGSNTSLSTTASTTDSTAVQFPDTRSTTPSASSASAPSETPTSESGGEALTTEKLEEFNQETGAAREKKNVKVGYKNIPSLDAIADRLAKARALSIDGSAKPPEAVMIEDPKTPGASMKAPEHPLQFPWTLYHDSKSKTTPATTAPQSSASDTGFSVHPPESTEYEAGLTVIGEFNTVEEFCRYFNWLKPPSKLEKNSNYHIFKSGIKPMWEDEANANGGKWVLTMKNNPALLDRCWSWLAMALVGEELEDGDEICGAVVSLRTKVDRIQVWTRSKDDVEKLNRIGKRLTKLLDVSEADNIGLEFQFNTEDRPLPNKFISIQAVPVSSYRPTFAGGPGAVPSLAARSISEQPSNSSSTGGAFGSFGIGLGSWKSSTNKRA